MSTDWVDLYREAWNSHEAERVTAFMADDVTYEDLAQGVVCSGRNAVQEYVEATHQFSADYRFLTVSRQASGNRYAIEWEMVGTDTGGGGGLPATGKSYRIRGTSVGEMDAEGKITINRDYWNFADYLAQVGLFPPGP